jgi:acyl-[acyl-carrier-protein]-phospholipid O-acyltransferase/long-chain-fatty-acid--[acyl-carrier-protein] ligase
MSNSQFLLMKERRFLPLFITQFFGAFHDNLFKNALVVLIIYQVAVAEGFSEKTQQLLTTLAAGVLILPFFLFSAMGGQLADKFPKEKIMQAVKLFEIGIAVLGILSLATTWMPLCYLTLFALGTHSALFSPSKYSILPQHLAQNQLIGGNALLNTGTFLAILLGTIIGTATMNGEHGVPVVGTLLLGASIIGYIASRSIPHAPPKCPGLKFSLNPVTETWAVMRYTLSQPRDITLALLGKGWFFFVGSMFMAQFANYTKSILGGNEEILTLFLVIFSIGIAIGGLCNNKLLRGKIAATFVPLAAIGLTIFSVDITLVSRNLMPDTTLPLIGVREFVTSAIHWRIMADVAMVAIFGGLFVVPLSAIIQDKTPEETRARIMAGSSIIDSIFMVASAVISAILIGAGWKVHELFFVFAIANAFVAAYICRLLPDYLFKTVLQTIFKLLYRVEVRGIENADKAGPRAVIVGNHVSLLDPPLLAAFLPGRPMFAVNTQVAKWWWLRPFLKLVDAFPLDPTNPYSIKSLIRKVEEDRHIVIFPEGRLTATGNLMKIYDGPGLIADKADAMILPVRIDGVQYTGFSRLRGKLPFKRFPKITITFLEPQKFKIDTALKGRARRGASSRQLYDVMENMMLVTTDREQTLWAALRKAHHINGGSYMAVDDANFSPLSYKSLIRKSAVLGHYLERKSASQENVGLMLPNSAGACVAFFALQSIGRVAAMINFTMGAAAIVSACQTAKIKTVLTSRRFVELGKLESLITAMEKSVDIIYLEDIASKITLSDKIAAFDLPSTKHISPHSPAVVLFTSGSEGAPKGVVLSHANLMTNIVQLAARVSFNQQDTVFNCLPMFHSFGLTGGTLLPILSGVKTFLYPNPLHIRIIPELVYDTGATILFGTDTFLAGYARMANPYDFYGVRYIFAGAEKVKDTTRKIYMDRFGVRILEGYGATETAPAIAVNSPMHQREGTVGRTLSGMVTRLESVPGVNDGGRLFVKGPNVMLGYYKDDAPGILQPPEEGWHDTGDIVNIDADGYIRILGRAKRFAKIAGEMVSLTVAESMAQAVWPDFVHAVVAIPDAKKGEQLVLLTTTQDARRDVLSAYATQNGIPQLAVPAVIRAVDKIPLLGTGKTDYNAVKEIAQS